MQIDERGECRLKNLLRTYRFDLRTVYDVHYDAEHLFVSHDIVTLKIRTKNGEALAAELLQAMERLRVSAPGQSAWKQATLCLWALQGLYIKDLESGETRRIYDNLDRDNQETWGVVGMYPNMDWTPDSGSIVFWSGGGIHRIGLSRRRCGPEQDCCE